MIKYITILLLLFVSFAANAQYTPNSGAYQWKGGKFTNSLQPPSTAGNPVTATNAPDSNSAALYYNETDTTWYQFNPITKVWSPFAGSIISSIDSLYITDTDSIFIISGNDTIFVGEYDQIRDTAYLTNGYGIQMINVVNPEDSFYKPNGYDINIRLDTSVLGDYIVQVINNDTTIINNNDSVPAIIVDTLSNSPPIGAASGYKVLIGTSPTGAFAAHANDIAELVGAVWNFTDPVCEMQVIVDNSATYATYQYKCALTAWVQTSVLWRVGGNRGVGTNAFIGRPDKQRFVIRAWNKVVAVFDTTQYVILPKFTGLDDLPLYFKPGPGGRIDTGRFRIATYSSPVNMDSVLYIDNGEYKYGTATGGGGSQTWQQTLDVGNQLNKDNQVGANFHSFVTDSLSFLGFLVKDAVTPNNSAIYATTDGVSFNSDDGTNKAVMSVAPSSNQWFQLYLDDTSYFNSITVHKDYFKFNKETISALPFPSGVSPNTKIVYVSPDTLLTEPEFMYVSDNDTIKKYPFSGGATTNWEDVLQQQGSTPFTTDNSVDLGNHSLTIFNTTNQTGLGITSDQAGATAIEDSYSSQITTINNHDGTTAAEVITDRVDDGVLPDNGHAVLVTADSMVLYNTQGNDVKLIIPGLPTSAVDDSRVLWIDNNEQVHYGAMAGGGGWGTTGTVATLTGNADLDLAGNNFTFGTVGTNATEIFNGNIIANYRGTGGGTYRPSAKLHFVATSSGTPINYSIYQDSTGLAGGIQYLSFADYTGTVQMRLKGGGSNGLLLYSNMTIDGTTPTMNIVKGGGGYASVDFYEATNRKFTLNSFPDNKFHISHDDGVFNDIVVTTSGNVGFGTDAPAASAKVEISSTTQGFLPPRMTATQASAISSPAEGLLVYVTDTNGTFTAKGWWGYDGAAWQKLNN